MNTPRRKKAVRMQAEEPESDDTFAYIAGYTDGGFPYGITWEEMQEIEIAESNARGQDETHDKKRQRGD